jgi:small subunit ribosomal protein S6e
MKLNVANPKNGLQKIFEFDNENDLRIFYDKKITNEVEVSSLGPEWKGFILKITGGQDKQGFPMKEGVLTNRRVRLLLSKGVSGCRGFGMKNGEKVRKSVRGCYVSPEISVLNLSISKEGKFIEGLTELKTGKLCGNNKKRADKIRKLYKYNKDMDIRTIYKVKNQENERQKFPKIQRLITPLSLQRKRFLASLKKKRIKNTQKNLKQYGELLQKLK